MRVGEGNAITEKILDRLVTYAGAHFAAEESLMELHQFPGLATQRIQHDMFRGRTKGFLERHRAGKPGLSVELLFFLQTWLKSHLMKTDKQYSAFLNSRGVH